MKLKLLLGTIAASFTAALALPFITLAAGTTSVVTPANMQGWSTFSPVDNRPQSSVEFSGDFDAPVGYGDQALKLTTSDADGKAQIMHGVPAGTKLDDIDTIAYSTFRSSDSTDGNSQVAGLNVGVDINGNDEGGFTTLVFEPVYQSGGAAGIIDGQWQRWDAGNDAMWWSTRTIPGATAFTSYVTLASLKAANTDAIVLYYGLNQGTGNPGIVSGVDAVSFGDTTYDFENDTVYPSNKDECKNDGWKTRFAEANFKNQGECVSFTTAKVSSTPYSLDSHDQNGIDVPTTEGSVYKIYVRNTWDNRGGEKVDAECTNWQNEGWKNEVNGGYSPDLLDVQLNKGFVNWGACNGDAHVYNYWVAGTGSPINLRVFDGDTNSNTLIPGWYGDNDGTLSITVEKHSKF
jgi:hypothetical protein